MSNLFDGLQRQAQGVVTSTMGYDASWTPSAGGGPYTARVLLNRPTQKETVTDEDYQAIRPRMEYFEGDLPGLLEAVRDNNVETVVINGIGYLTLRAELKHDGKTVIVYLDNA